MTAVTGSCRKPASKNASICVLSGCLVFCFHNCIHGVCINPSPPAPPAKGAGWRMAHISGRTPAGRDNQSDVCQMGRARARGRLLQGCFNTVHSLGSRALLFPAGRAAACSSRHEDQPRCLATSFGRLAPNDSTGGNSQSFQQTWCSPKV